MFYLLYFIFCVLFLGVENLLSEGVKAPSVLNGGLDNAYVLLGMDIIKVLILSIAFSCKPITMMYFLSFLNRIMNCNQCKINLTIDFYCITKWAIKFPL